MGMFGGGLNVVLSTLLSLIQTTVGGIMSIAKQGLNAMMQFNDESIHFARSTGMSLKESQAYANVLVERASELGIKYGIASDKVLELQRNLTSATGRAMMLNNEDAEKFVQIGKLVGADTASSFQSTIINKLGGQIHTVTGAISKAYTTAMKSGLDAATFSKKVADNLSLANKYSFRNGIDGITRMTAMSEKLGVNMDSIAKSMDNFMDLDKAIENSAKLNMLGGAAGAFGSNPLTMAYEANYDPEAFMERAKDTLGGLATFDAKTGTANVNGMNRDFVKSIAEAMGMSMEDAMTMAKKQAEIKYKESQFGGQLSNLSQEQRDYVLNRSYIGENGQLQMTDSNGNRRSVDDLAKSGELDKMKELGNKSDSDVMKDMAMHLSTVSEIMEGIKTSLVGDAAKSFQGVYGTLQKTLPEIGQNLREALQHVWPKLADGVQQLITYLKDNQGLITKGIGVLGKIISTIMDNFGTVIGILMAGSVLGGGKLLKGGVNAFKAGYRLFNPKKQMLARGLPPQYVGTYLNPRFTNTKLGNLGASKGMNFLTGGQSGRIVNSFRSARRTMGMSKFGAAKFSVGQGIKGMSKFSKGVGILGVLAGAAQVGNSIMDYSENKDNLNKQLRSGAINKTQYDSQVEEAKNTRNEGIGSAVGSGLGTAIGTIFGGPIGGMIGAVIGDKVGGFVGKHFNTILSGLGKGIKWVGDKLGKFFTWCGDKIKWFFNFITAPIRFIGRLVKSIASPIIKKVKGFFGFETGGIIGGDSYHGDKLKANVNSGEMILTMSQQKKLFDFANSATSLFGRNRSYVKKGIGEKRSLVIAKPVGDKEYIHKPSRSNASENRSIKINDFNINISGTIKLDGGNTSKNIDINKLLSNHEFVSSLKEIIKSSINNDINGGRLMNDDSLRRGAPSQVTLWGRK